MPIVNSNDELVALITGSDLKKSRDFPQSSDDRNGRLMVGAAINTRGNFENTVDLLVEAGVDVLVIDTSSDASADTLLKWIKEQHPGVEVVAGNVDTMEKAEHVINAGADALQIEVESTCKLLTRKSMHFKFTILGITQGDRVLGRIPLINLFHIAKFARSRGIPVIAKIREVSHITKALALGASTVIIDATDADSKITQGVTATMQDQNICQKFLQSLILQIQKDFQKIGIRSLDELQ